MTTIDAGAAVSIVDKPKKRARRASAQAAPATITIALDELKELLRPFVRDVVREEMGKPAISPIYNILNDWAQEGPDDPEEDERVLREALATLDRYRADRSDWMTLDEFERQLENESNHLLSSTTSPESVML